ncbi:MAG: metal-dependent hydrolase, partial [Cyanobacteria bacterium P01_F01_bin.116]
TGGPGEYWVLTIAVGLLVAGLWLAGAGGVQTQVNQGLGLRDGAISTYNRNASTSEVWAEITGVWADDRTDATGKYLILGNQGSEFIITDGKSIYQTGQNIIVEKLVTKAGEATQRTLKTLSFSDQDLSPALGELLAFNPGASVYLTGSIVVDFPEEIRPVSGGRQLQTLTVAGDAVELTYHPLEVAIAQLNDQWATGTLTALILAEP